MQEIKDDLKAIRADVNEIRILTAVNTVSLTTHMERTVINERRLEKLEYLLIALAIVTVLGGVVKVLIG